MSTRWGKKKVYLKASYFIKNTLIVEKTQGWSSVQKLGIFMASSGSRREGARERKKQVHPSSTTPTPVTREYQKAESGKQLRGRGGGGAQKAQLLPAPKHDPPPVRQAT